MHRPDFRTSLRLPLLVALSALVHAGAIAFIARHPTAPPRAPAVAAVSVRLAQADSAKAPLPDQGQASTPSAPRPRQHAGPVADIAPAPPQATAAPEAGEAVGSADAGLHYNVRLPRPADLRYEVSDGGSQSRLQVDTGVTDFSIRFADLPDPGAGRGARVTIDSAGGGNDTGLAPLAASVGLGKLAFDQENGQVRLADGKAVAFNGNLLDPASLFVQLAGMGVADPEQFQDQIHIGVAGAGVITFDVLGLEQVDGPMGSHQAWHLAQRAKSGESRMELWLAPAQNWYPVQIRTTAPDGTVVWQKLAQAEWPAAALP